MTLPYLCDFRFFIHIWKTEEFDDHEVLYLETSSNNFILRSKEKFEKDKSNLNGYLFNVSRGLNLPENIKFSEGMHMYLNGGSLRAEEYGKELLSDGDLIQTIIKDDIKAEGDKYFEVSGTLHEFTSRDYWGEYDSDYEIENLNFQEVAEEDVKLYLKEINNE